MAKKGKDQNIHAGEVYQYDAFISYRHVQPDKAIAENLHKQLENFKLPKNVKASLKNGHTQIQRVFRDEEELPIASSLEDAIVTALKNSEWLIVICSPRILESAWCRLEISTFIKLHGRDHVLAVLVEGEPDEAIPEELLYEEVTTYNALGVPETTKKRVEPLACDIRDKSTKNMIKKLESQKLRLLAKMFNLNYDDLRQRHREKAMRRKLKLVSIAAIVMFIIFLISAIGFIAVYMQNKKINEQNIELETQAEVITNQNTSLLRSQAVNVAQNAMEEYASDNRQHALELAYSSLTTIDGNEMPYTAIGECALAQALNVYANLGTYGSFAKFSMPGVITESDLSLDGTKYFALDNVGNLYIWDTINLANIGRVNNIKTTSFTNMYSYVLLDDSRLIYISEVGIHLYNIDTMNDSLIKSGNYSGLTINSSRTMVCAVESVEHTIDVIDVNDASIIRTFESQELLAPMANSNIVTDSFEGENENQTTEIIDSTAGRIYKAWLVLDHIVYQVEDVVDDEAVTFLRVIDLNTMSIVKQYQLEATSVLKAMVVNNHLYYISHYDLDYSNQVQRIGRIDMNTDSTDWINERSTYSSELKCFTLDSSEVLFTYSYNNLVVLSGETGETIGEANGFDNVINVSVTDNNFYFITSDNYGFTMPYENGTYGSINGFSLVNSSLANFETVQRINIGVGETFITRRNDNHIYVYREIQNQSLTSVNSSGDNLGSIESTYIDEYLDNLNADEPFEGVRSVMHDNSNSVVCVNYYDNSFSLFVDNEYVGSYDSSLVHGAYYIPIMIDSYYGTDDAGNYYVANEGVIGFRISPEGEVLAVIYGLCGFNSNDNTIIRYVNGGYYAQQVYSTEELISMAEVLVDEN